MKTTNLLDYLYHQNYYNVISTNLSKQTFTFIPQQINFTHKLQEDDGAEMFFITKIKPKTVLNFSLY